MILKYLRIFFSVLLLCSVLIPLTVPRSVRSQTVTTGISVQYSMASSTMTMYSTTQMTTMYTQPVHYLLTPPNYNNQTGHFSLFQEDSVSRPTRFGDSEDYTCLYYDYFLLNATAGQEIRGHFEVVKTRFEAVNRAIDLFILNLDQLRAFKNSRCGYGNWDWQVHAVASSYDLDWITPQSGEYALLFLSNDSYFQYNFYGSYLFFMAQAYSTKVQSKLVILTTTKTYTLQSTQIMLSTLQSANPPSSTTNYYLVALIVVIAIVLIVIIVKSRMKRQAQ